MSSFFTNTLIVILGMILIPIFLYLCSVFITYGILKAKEMNKKNKEGESVNGQEK